MTRLIFAIALAMAFLAIAAGLKYAGAADLIGTDIAQRAVQAMIGLMLAGYANLMPKQIGSRRASLDAEARVQTARRAGGWSLTLAGLAYAIIWGVAPLTLAPIISMAVVGTGLAVTAGFALWACSKAGTTGATPGS